MFSRTFSIVMTPAVFLVGIASMILYVYVGVGMAATDGAWPAFFWFAFYGHIVSGLAAALVVGIPLAILAFLAACTAWLFGLGWRLQKRGVESLPFKVERKDTPLEEEGIEQMLDRLYLKIRQDAQADPSLPWREH